MQFVNAPLGLMEKTKFFFVVEKVHRFVVKKLVVMISVYKILVWSHKYQPITDQPDSNRISFFFKSFQTILLLTSLQGCQKV